MKGQYAAQWAAFRRRRNIAWCAFLGSVPVFALLGNAKIAAYLASPVVPYLLGASWLGAVLWCGMRAISFPCPRCGQPFLRGTFYHNAFSRSCLHCDLQKWADNDATPNELSLAPDQPP